MNGAHWHIVLNHFPFIGGLLATLVMIGGYLFKNQSVKITGLILLIITGLVTIPAFVSGEEAEEVLEAIGKDDHDMIHEHEEAAELALWVMEAAAALALVSLVMHMRKLKLANSFTLITLILCLAASGMFMNVNNLGGKIRHTEIREQGAAATDPTQHHEAEHEH